MNTKPRVFLLLALFLVIILACSSAEQLVEQPLPQATQTLPAATKIQTKVQLPTSTPEPAEGTVFIGPEAMDVISSWDSSIQVFTSLDNPVTNFMDSSLSSRDVGFWNNSRLGSTLYSETVRLLDTRENPWDQGLYACPKTEEAFTECSLRLYFTDDSITEIKGGRLVVFQLGSSETQTDPPAAQFFRDDFTESLQPDWEWENENPSRWKITPEGWLQIVGEDESLLGTGAQSNLLCRDAPAGDFQITIHVYADPRADFQQATLYLYQDGDNFVAINRGYCSPCEIGGSGMFMEYKSAGNWDAYNIKAENLDVFLRLLNQDGIITGYYAFDVDEWKSFGIVENNLENIKICLGVSNVDTAGLNADLVGEFDFIEISQP